ncbi:MAG: ABC transporter permease [Caldilineaceae bacterium]|nr:ABC transporter permease [Caldilineaceae bacterium]
MRLKTISTLAGYELRSSLRNRWFLLYALAFAVLAVALSSLSLTGAGMFGFAGFGRTAASLINLVLLIVPLMGLTIGAQSLASEREKGTLAYLLAQPVSRAEVLWGKFVGLGTALLAALLLGFGLSAAVIAWQGGVVEAQQYISLVGFSLLLALVTLSLGIFLSAWSRSSALAVGLALFAWLALVFIGDLGLMSTAVAMKVKIQTLFGLALINPLQVFKIAAVNSLRASLEILGPAGIYATRTYGDALITLLVSVLLVWVLVALGAAYLRFRVEADF